MDAQITGEIKVKYPEGRSFFYCGEKIEGTIELTNVPKSVTIKALEVRLLSTVEYIEDDASFQGKDSDAHSDDSSSHSRSRSHSSSSNEGEDDKKDKKDKKPSEEGGEGEGKGNTSEKKEEKPEEEEEETTPTEKTTVLQKKELVKHEITVKKKGGTLITVPFVILTSSAYRGSFSFPRLSRTSLVYTIDVDALKRHMLVATAVAWHGAAEITLVPHQPIKAHPDMLEPSSYTLSKVTKKRLFSRNDGMDMDVTINRTAFKAKDNVSLKLVITNKTKSATIMSVITRLTMRVENVKNKKKSRTSDVLTDMKGCLNYLPGTKNDLQIDVAIPDELPLSESGGNAVFNVSYYLVVFVEDDRRKAQITFPIKVIIGNDGSPFANDNTGNANGDNGNESKGSSEDK